MPKPKPKLTQDAARSSDPVSGRYKVAVVEDHPIMRSSIVTTIRSHAAFEVVAEGETARDAIEIVAKEKPDILVLDLNIPGTGTAAIAEISNSNSETKVLVLTAYDDYSSVTAALRAGASGYTLKGISKEELLSQIEDVLENRPVIAPDLAIRLLKGDEHRLPDQQPATADAFLSAREQRILAELKLGKSNGEIAESLGLAESTVKNHVTHILEKLHARNRVEAVLRALPLN